MRTTPKLGRFGLIPLLIVCGSIWLGILIAQWAFHHFGWIGGVLGFVGGVAIFATFVFLLDLWERRRLRKK
jgi:hypothetical protein